jgi:uncharacterized protein DUF5658
VKDGNLHLCASGYIVGKQSVGYSRTKNMASVVDVLPTHSAAWPQMGIRSRRWLRRIASAVIILNLIDAIFTLCYTSVGMATESNPLMRGPLASSPVLFMITKLTLVSLCVMLLWRLAHRGTAVLGLLAATAMYLLLIGYHLTAVPRLFAGL